MALGRRSGGEKEEQGELEGEGRQDCRKCYFKRLRGTEVLGAGVGEAAES